MHSSNIPNSQGPLLIGQPSRRAWKVGQNKGADGGYDDSGDALNDEQPLPRAEPARPVHSVGHACRDEAGEGAGNQGARVQDGGSEAKFLASVPAREVVQTSRAVKAVRCQRSGRCVGGREMGVLDSQIRGFDDTQKEAVGQQTRSVGADSCQRRDNTPDNHLAEEAVY